MAKMKHLITRHYAIASFGYFSVLATLLLMLGQKAYAPGQVALAFTVFTVLNRLAKLAVAPWLDRHAPATGILIGCLMTSASVLLIPMVSGFWPVIGLLAACASGMSINAIASKQLAAEVAQNRDERMAVFSKISAVGNLSAAAAAPIATYLLSALGAASVGVVAGAAYCTAGLSTWRLARRLPQEWRVRSDAQWVTWSQTLGSPGLPLFFVVNAMGWMLYYQLFSVVPLQVSANSSLAPYLGTLLTCNTLLVAALQVPLSGHASRIGLAANERRVVVAYSMFALSFLVLALSDETAWPLLPFVFIYSVAEMLFVPTIDALFLDRVPRSARAKGYALLSVSTAVGEGFGAWAGLHGYPLLKLAGLNYWWVLCAAAAVFSLSAHLGLGARSLQTQHA